ncbi:MAG: PQQ-binding-like beta-propeller repeat protein [Candidatus Hydrogenedentota bacterium]
MKFNRHNSLMTITFLLVSAFNSHAQDWPQWRGANHDGHVSGFIAPERWPDGLTKSWDVVVGSGDATPALVDGRLYTFSRQESKEITRCLNTENGVELWRNEYDSIEIKGGARSHSGPRSSPAVVHGKVVTIGVAGVLTCLNAESGEVVWRKDEFPGEYSDYYTSASPLIVENTCVAQLGGNKAGAIIAYNLDDGSEVWRWEGDPPAYASPTVLTVEGRNQIVALTDQNLVGISATDGKLLWQVPFPVPRMSTNSATPVVLGQTVIYSAQKRGVHAVRVEIVEDGYRATPLWSNEKLSTAFNTPVGFSNLLFGLSDRTHLYCLDAMTGAVLWTDEARHERFGSIVYTESALFALPSNGVLTIYEPSGTHYSRLAQYPISDSPTYAHPVVSGDRVYIQDQNTVTAWAFR